MMFADYRDHVGALPDKQFKSTLFRSDRLMLGLNCLSPGQEQHLHEHGGQDKFYFVVEGEGRFVVGAETRTAGEGTSADSRSSEGFCRDAMDGPRDLPAKIPAGAWGDF
jgi:hypothetical protein